MHEKNGHAQQKGITIFGKERKMERKKWHALISTQDCFQGTKKCTNRKRQYKSITMFFFTYGGPFRIKKKLNKNKANPHFHELTTKKHSYSFFWDKKRTKKRRTNVYTYL